MPSFDAVFFDVGNTLLYPYPSVSRVGEELLLDAGHGPGPGRPGWRLLSSWHALGIA